jgi:NTP pyrophosphatase (non-canonical NTP hydrolase)
LKDIMVDEFQYLVHDMLVRNKSILDSMTKFHDSASRVNRSISKAVTQCGCVEISAKKQDYPDNADFDDIQETLSTHFEGKLCDNCRDAIEKEIGRELFYLASLCNILDLNLYDIIIKEYERIKMFGKYNLK